MIDPKTILKIDAARMDGLSAGELLDTLEKSGHPDPQAAFKEYLNTPLKDGRLRSQVNLGDPAEWE